MAKTVSVVHKQRSNTAANWATGNPVLALGQIGVVTDTTPWRFKIGDGTTTWNSLPFVGEVMGISQGTATSLANLPVNVSSIVVSISYAQSTFSYSGTPLSGFQQSILLKNTGSYVITQAIPNTSGWKAMDGTSVSIPIGGSVELNVWYIDSVYRVAAKA